MLPRLVVNVLEEHGLHLLDPSLTLRIAVGIVQIHADLADVLALPVQPQHLVPELPHGSRELLEAHAILVVDALHPLLHLLEVRLHVRLHLAGQRRVHVVEHYVAASGVGVLRLFFVLLAAVEDLAEGTGSAAPSLAFAPWRGWRG